MAIYDCDIDVGVFSPDPCIVRPGRVRFVFLFNATAAAVLIGDADTAPTGDATDLADWTPLINSGDVIVLGATTGDYPKPSATEIEGVGHIKSVLASYQHVVNFMLNGRVEYNRDFFNKLSKSGEWYVGWGTGNPGNMLNYFSDVPASFRPAPPVPVGTQEAIRWDVSAAWDSSEIPHMYAVPDGLYT